NPAISPEVAQFILKAMAKDPDERFQSCAEFLRDIRDYERVIIERSNKKKKKRLWRLVALVAILGVVFAMYQWLKQTERNALYLIQSGSDKALTICQELKRVQEKEEAIEALKPLDPKYVDPTTRDSLEERIKEHKKNIDERISSYRDSLTKLQRIQDTIVEKEFEEYALMLEDRKLFDQAHTTRLMKIHYQQYRDSQQSVDVSVMREGCARQL